MKNILLLILLITISSCKKESEEIKTTNLDVVFNVEYDGAPVVASTEYNYTENQKIQFTKLQFYVSSISLTKGDMHEKTELKNIDLLDFTTVFSSQSTSENGLEYRLINVPLGDYSGIGFNIGVDPNLNSTIPSDYSSSHPLSDDNFYWEEHDSYIFAKLEGSFDSDGDGTFETSFSYHTGTDILLQKMLFLKNITLEIDKSALVNIKIDLKKILIQNDSILDIAQHPVVDDPISSTYGGYIAMGFKNAFSIQ